MKNYIKEIIVLATVLGVAGTVFAEEVAGETVEKDHGIRVSLGYASGINEVGIDGLSAPVDDDNGGVLEVLYQRRHWSDVEDTFCGTWGAGFFFAGHSGSESTVSAEFDMSAFGIMGQGGVAFKAGDIVVFEVQPYLGVGAANLEASMGGMTDDESGAYAVFGIKAGAFFKVSKSIELGIEAGYQSHAGVADVDGIEIDYTGDGLRANGVIAIKF